MATSLYGLSVLEGRRKNYDKVRMNNFKKLFIWSIFCFSLDNPFYQANSVKNHVSTRPLPGGGLLSIIFKINHETIIDFGFRLMWRSMTPDSCLTRLRFFHINSSYLSNLLNCSIQKLVYFDVNFDNALNSQKLCYNSQSAFSLIIKIASLRIYSGWWIQL